jgi:RNA polymerase-binding transcription factor DksA
MDKTLTSEMKTRLTAEQKQLKERLSRISKKDPHVKGDYDAKWPQYGEDMDRMYENALETTDYTNAIGVENVLELRLGAVERALGRISKGTFGVCSNCKAEQSRARLNADPAAERCLDCGHLV